MRELRITTIQGIVYLYPLPVIKENKYLVRCATLQEANELIEEIKIKKIPHPDNAGDSFQVVSIHTDQKTKILEKKSR